MIRILVTALALLLLYPDMAFAGPVAAALAVIKVAFTAATIGGFILRTVAAIAINLVVARLTAPSMKSAAQERQADVMSLTLGEGPREAIFGKAATAGQLLDAYNFGGANGTDWEVLVIAVADHRCEALEGYYVGDTYYAFSADGVQSGFNSQLEVYWKNGAPGQSALSYLVTTSAGRASGAAWTSSDVVAGVAYVVFAYKADAPNASTQVWTTGRPSFKAVVKGKRCYDPRKDSTVAGGSGAHRWTDPSTWEWTENARICDYNYDRGVYAEDDVSDPSKLLIGRGLSALEAPPERVIAAANVCDESVTLKAGGTEKRYRVGGVIRSDEAFITVKEYFAAAMAGVIVQRDGGVEVEPGAAKSAVVTITDDDLVAGEPIVDEGFLSDNERVNTVIPRYIEPAQLWKDHGAPVRRSTTDITTDGGVRSRQLSLSLVTSGTQAQRCAEIERRLARKERRFGIVLGPRFAGIEDGDWISWTSARYFGGGTVTFRVESSGVGVDWRNNLALREIAASCYSWDPATDEATPGAAPIDPWDGPPILSLSGAAFSAVALAGGSGVVIPGVKATWTTPVDPAITGVRMEVRKAGSTDFAVSSTNDPNSGKLIATDGVIAGVDIEVRLVPIVGQGRRGVATSWTTVSAGSITITNQSAWATWNGFTPGQIGGRTQYLDNTTGKLTNVQGLGPPTSAMGQALVVDHQPLSSDDSHVYIDGFTVTGFGGFSRSFSGFTFSGMPAGNGWYIIVYWPTGGYGLADNTDLDGYLASGDWFLLGLIRTSSGGSYAPPPATTPGFYGGSNGNPYISEP